MPIHLSETVTVQLSLDGLGHSGTGRGHIELDLPPELTLRPLAVGAAMKTAVLSAIEQAFTQIQDPLADYWTSKLALIDAEAAAADRPDDQDFLDSEPNV